MTKLITLLMLLTLLICFSCTTVPAHKLAYMIRPSKNMLCQQSDFKGKRLKEEKCFPINFKDDRGQFKFLQYGGYIGVSMRAIKETLHAAEK